MTLPTSESKASSDAARPCCAAQSDPSSSQPETGEHAGRGWLRTAVMMPAAILPLLPAATCPFCLAAYAGVLSFLGLGYLLNEQVLAPLIVSALLLGIASIAWTTRSHKKAAPLVGAILGAAGVVAGRLVWNVPVLLYLGVALLLGASVWNLWLKRRRRSPLIQLQ